MTRLGQAFDDLLLALPMHAEVLELLLDGQRTIGVFFDVEEIPDGLGLLLRQRLAHVEPVGLDHTFEGAKLVRQFLRSTWAYGRHVQFVEQAAQRGAGRKLGAQFTLLLQLQSALVLGDQGTDHVLVMAVFKETVNLVGHFQTDIRQVRQHFRQRLLHALQGRQGARQHLGGLLAHIGNAEGVDKPCKGWRLAVFDGGDQLLAGDIGKAFQVDDLFVLELVEVSRRADQFLVHQLLDGLVAQAIDVHGPARDEMNDRLLELRTAGQAPNATVYRAFADGFLALAALDQLRALNVRAAHRAALGDLHRAGVFRATLGDHRHHLGNHVTGTADDHGVADHQAQARHFVHVVQGGVGHGHTRNLDRFQACHGRHSTGATHLELNVQQFGQFLHRRELVGDCPTRFAGTEAQFTLVGNAIDLEHHTVDFIGQGIPSLTDIAVVIEAILNPFGQFQLMADGHAPFLQLLQIANVGVADIRGHAVAAEFQRTAGGNLRIQLAQAARSRVARVGEGLATDLQLRGVQPLEAGLGHEHFAAHFKGRRPAGAVQFQRNITHGAHVDADVFAGGAIAARGATHQFTVLIQQADRQAIELRLAAVFHRRAAAKQVTHRQVQALSDPAIEFKHGAFIEGVAEAEHRDFVTHLSERRQCRTADPLRR